MYDFGLRMIPNFLQKKGSLILHMMNDNKLQKHISYNKRTLVCDDLNVA